VCWVCEFCGVTEAEDKFEKSWKVGELRYIKI
jgi:hypothetical protein